MLLHSENPYEQLRANLLTLRDLNDWVNRNIRVDPLYEGRRLTHMVETKFHYAFFTSIMESGKAPLQLMHYTDADLCYAKINKLLGEPILDSDDKPVWMLDIKEWPVVTIELLERSFIAQNHSGSHVVPIVLEEQLPVFFPESDYLTLLTLFKNDLLSFEKVDNGVPTLAELLTIQNVSPASISTDLPDTIVM